MTDVWTLRGLGGEQIAVEPALGGKISSLRDPAGHEWLIIADDRGPSPRGGGFEDAEMWGWDECAPTIDACVLADGTSVGDHGDVWQQAWAVDADGVMRAALPHADALLEREIALAPGGGFVLTYRVRAGASPAPMLWAAHPQFAVPYEAEVLLDAPTSWVDVTDGAPRPIADDDYRPSTRGVAVGASRKVYVVPGAPVGAATLRLSDGRELRLSWDGPPYLGVWISNRHIAREKTIAIEPCTGWYDDLRRAVDGDRVLTVAPGAVATWSLTIRFGADIPTTETPLG